MSRPPYVRLCRRTRRRRPLALVYRGHASLPYCPEAAAAMVRASSHDFTVRFIGERESLKLTASNLHRADLYVQPGGGSLESAWTHLHPHRETIRNFVASGGRYLGICLGAYLAGATPGFGLLDGDTDRYIDTDGADAIDEEAHLITVRWGSQPRAMYFQDGPTIVRPHHLTSGTQVLARYHNGCIAALVSNHGRGRVGVVGPHPEATSDWFIDDCLPMAADHALEAGLELIDAIMATPTSHEHPNSTLSRDVAPTTVKDPR